MSLSDKKLEANRANAQKSTGPQSAPGKAISALNARQHGLSSKSAYIPDGRGQEFLELYVSLLEEIQPAGEVQSQYFDQMVHAAWHALLAREHLTLAYHAMDDKKIANFTRLLGVHERAYTRAHKALSQVQTDFALRVIDENEPIADLPVTVSTRALTNEATKLASTHEPNQRRRHRYLTLARIGDTFRAAHPANGVSDEPSGAAGTPIDSAA